MMKFFFEIHKGNPQEGPGSDECTERALRVIADRLPVNPRVLDVGCGPGRQTMLLSQLLPKASITALDKYQWYLDQLNASIKVRGISNITTINGSMDDMPFQEQFDLIWSEGALYIMGVENALKYLQGYLKPNGFLSFSDLVWIKPDVPDEIRSYLGTAGAEDVSREKRYETIENAGYLVEDHFVLPEEAWLDNYYAPIAKRLKMMDEQHGDDPEYQEAAASEREEVAMYKKYKDYYGYVFYVCRKR